MWSQYRELSGDFWWFFAAALLYEAGFGIYFFLFNLYLLDLRFDERAIGFINGALSLGLLATTIPVGMLSRRLGSRRLLLVCFVTAPGLGVLRAICTGEAAQIGLAFAAGLVMSVWTVCFLPVSASITREQHRAAAIGLIFSVGIGATALGSGASGYLSHWICTALPHFTPRDGKRVILLCSCIVSALGTAPLMRVPNRWGQVPGSMTHLELRSSWKLLRNPFLQRYVPCMALWTALPAAFLAFAGVYLIRERHFDLTGVGLIFSLSQVAQLVAGLALPSVVRTFGLLRGIVATQLATALMLAAFVIAGASRVCIPAFLAYSLFQWISSTMSYTLLMNEMPETRRSEASAITMFCNSLFSAGITTAVGALLLRFGYERVFLGMAIVLGGVGTVFSVLMHDPPSTCSLPERVWMEDPTD